MSGIRCIYIAALALVVFLRKPSKATIYCHALARLCGLQAAPQTLAKPNAHIGAPGKTVAIAEKSALSTDFPLRAERNRKIVIPPPHTPAERQTSGHL